MRTVTNVVKPGTAERLANAKKRVAAQAQARANSRKRESANPAAARMVAAAIAANRRAKCARRHGRGI